MLRGKIRGLRQTLPMRRSIATSRSKILRVLEDSRDVTFVRGLGNIGDQLIHAGTRRLLAGMPYKEVVVRRRPNGQGDVMGLGKVRGHTVLITGSGGWCGPHHALMPQTLRIVERRFERVIVLPSSVDTSIETVRQALARTKALFFAREYESYSQVRELCKSEIAHDCAFFFDYAPYKLRGEGWLTAYRTDNESVTGGEVPPGNNDISKSCKSLDEWLWTIARHEAVETDRAHVMIASAMLGKRVKYRPGTYHKVPAIAEYALNGFPLERMPEGPFRKTANAVSITTSSERMAKGGEKSASERPKGEDASLER